MPPEIIRRNEYDGLVADMWSLGIILHALLCGYFPYRGKNHEELNKKISKGNPPDLSHDLDPRVRDLLFGLLTSNVSNRMSITDVLHHPWITHPIHAVEEVTPLNILRKEMPILISDNTFDDIDDEVLNEFKRFGINKDDVTSAVLNRKHSSMSTFYYLLRNVFYHSSKNFEKKNKLNDKNFSSSFTSLSISSNPAALGGILNIQDSPQQSGGKNNNNSNINNSVNTNINENPETLVSSSINNNNITTCANMDQAIKKSFRSNSQDEYMTTNIGSSAISTTFISNNNIPSKGIVKSPLQYYQFQQQQNNQVHQQFHYQ